MGHEVLAVSLLSPLMLWGLALLAMPVAAHLLNRRSRRRVVFPSIRLLSETVAMQSHLFRLRRLLLLLLRCLAVAFIVWAFARPEWFSATDAESDPDAGAGVVVVLDASASTGYGSGRGRTIDRLKTRAQRTLDGLRSGRDVADVVIADARPRAVFGRLIANLDALQAELGPLEPSFDRADVYEAVRIAGRLLAEHGGTRHVVIVSDLQRSNWEEIAAGGSVLDLLPPETAVTVADTGASDEGNVAVSSGRVSPPRPIAGQPAQAVVQVSNHGRDPASVEVELLIDDLPAAAPRHVTLAPREQREIAFEVAFADEIERELRFTITPDGLRADDTAVYAVRPVDRLPVLVIADDDPHQPGSSSFFLVRALSPHGDARDAFQVQHVGSRSLDAATLRDAPVIFVGDVAALDDPTAAAIAEHIDAGGGVVLMLGEGPVRENLEKLDRLAGVSPLLPWHAGTVRHLAPGDPASRIVDGAWQSALLRAFDQRSQFGLAQVPFDRVWTAEQVHVDTQVLLKFGDGTPALGLRPIGDGQVALANFSPSVRVSGFGRYGSFVALVQSLAEVLQSDRGAARDAVVGSVTRLTVSTGGPTGGSADATSVRGGEPVRVRDPRGEPVDDAEVIVTDDLVDVVLPRPARPGFHRVQRGSATIGRIAVNLDPRESDLTAIDRDTLVAMLGGGEGRLRVAAAGEASLLVEERGHPLWSWFLTAAMVALGLELLVLSVWGRP